MTTKELSKLLDRFKKDTLAKFERGRAEHGENFEEIDYDGEIMGEIMDLLVYHWLQRKYGRKVLTMNPKPEHEEKVEVIKVGKDGMCMIANGKLICQCGNCQPKQYELPEDFNNL